MSEKNVLTADERRMIRLLDDPLYTVDFVEEWLSRPPEGVYFNAPAALQQIGVQGFMHAVRHMVKYKVRYEIYSEVDREFKYADIRSRLEGMCTDELFGFSPDVLCADEQFLDKVLNRWEDSQGWCDSIWDTNWELCDLAIEEVLKSK